MTHYAAPIASVVVYAKDMKTLARFYSCTLELKELEAESGFILLAGNGVEIAVVAIPEAMAARINISSPATAREETPLKFRFLVTGLAQAVEKATLAGGAFKLIASAWSWRGMKRLDGQDPEGSVLQLRQVQSDA